MPNLQDIEQFKRDLVTVGREEEILSERGEEIEDISPPDEGLSDDLSELLGTADADEEVSSAEIPSPAQEVVPPPEQAPEPSQSEEPPGFSVDELDDLGDLDIDESVTIPHPSDENDSDESSGPTEPISPESEVPSTDEGFDIDGIFPPSSEGELDEAGEGPDFPVESEVPASFEDVTAVEESSVSEDLDETERGEGGFGSTGL